MDVEKARRNELMMALGSSFDCFEEVILRHPTFQNHTIRADLVAVPVDSRFNNYALAFEVKNATPDWSAIEWCEAIKQASDYVYATIEPNQASLEAFSGRRISASFIFPAPPYDRFGTHSDGRGVIRENEVTVATGALHLALHFRVGRAYWWGVSSGQIFSLSLGPNLIWDAKNGFRKAYIGLVTGKRSIGSQMIDVMKELSGFRDQD